MLHCCCTVAGGTDNTTLPRLDDGISHCHNRNGPEMRNHTPREPKRTLQELQSHLRAHCNSGSVGACWQERNQSVELSLTPRPPSKRLLILFRKAYEYTTINVLTSSKLPWLVYTEALDLIESWRKSQWLKRRAPCCRPKPSGALIQESLELARQAQPQFVVWT